MDDTRAWEIALDDHPEFREGFENDSLPEEMLGEDGEPISPRLHLMLHVIVEQQLAADAPPGIAEIAEQLTKLGVSRHEIRHVIGGPLAEQLWLMQTQQAAFDSDAYLDQLREAVDSHR
jgi:hypothetical protein